MVIVNFRGASVGLFLVVSLCVAVDAFAGGTSEGDGQQQIIDRARQMVMWFDHAVRDTDNIKNVSCQVADFLVQDNFLDFLTYYGAPPQDGSFMEMSRTDFRSFVLYEIHIVKTLFASISNKAVVEFQNLLWSVWDREDEDLLTEIGGQVEVIKIPEKGAWLLTSDQIKAVHQAVCVEDVEFPADIGLRFIGGATLAVVNRTPVVPLVVRLPGLSAVVRVISIFSGGKMMNRSYDEGSVIIGQILDGQ